MVLIVYINLGVCMVSISSGPGEFRIISATFGTDHDKLIILIQVSRQLRVTAGHNHHKCLHTVGLHTTRSPVLVHDSSVL